MPAVVLSLVGVCGPAWSADTSRLEGVWQFEKEIDTRPDGTRVIFPEAGFDGLLIYRADGFMSVNIMPKGRTWTTDNATLDELRTTVAGGTGYAGRYEIDERTHTVTHIVAVSLDPADAEKRLVRHYAFEGPKLVLSGEWTHDGEPLLFHVTWTRVSPTDAADAPPRVPAGRTTRVPPRPVPAPVLVARTTPDGGTIRTALMTFSEPAVWGSPIPPPDPTGRIDEACRTGSHAPPVESPIPRCSWFGLALSFDGQVRYFKTITWAPLAHRSPLHDPPDVRFNYPMFGEEVVLYGGDNPTRMVRENGDVYDLEPTAWATTRMYFSPRVVHTNYEDLKYPEGNPHPEAMLDECRRLADPIVHDSCLRYQAGLLRDDRLCDEFVAAERADACRTWLANLRSGNVNK